MGRCRNFCRYMVKGLIWRNAQQWTFVPIVSNNHVSKNSGWTFYISNKVGAGKTRYMAINASTPINAVNKRVLNVAVYTDPKYYNFEFIPTEIRIGCS